MAHDSQKLKGYIVKNPYKHQTLCFIFLQSNKFTLFFTSSYHLPFYHTPATPLQEFVGADGDNDNAEVSTPDVVESVAQLLHLEGSQELSFALTTLRTTTRGG